MRLVPFLLIILIGILFPSCINNKQSNKLIIFHAGSLSVPFKQIAKKFEQQNPNTKVILEAAGSRTCARKISDLNKPCDIMASADYKVIDNLLIPEYANWNLKFATNEMAIVYTEKSKFQNSINLKNWPDILLRPDVNYGRSDPNTDPCGYRAVLCTKLANIYFERPYFSDSILAKNKQHIRPKEVDLIALLETQVLDYIFLYRSVAEQHNLKHLILPDSLNLKKNELTSFYNIVSTEVSGKKPGEKIKIYGEPMVYGITQLANSSNPELAEKFLKFFFTDRVGIKLMKKNGQPSTKPCKNPYYNILPTYLQPFAMSGK